MTTHIRKVLVTNLDSKTFQEGFGTTREREERRLQALRKLALTFYFFHGIDGRNVRFRSKSISKEVYKVAC